MYIFSLSLFVKPLLLQREIWTIWLVFQSVSIDSDTNVERNVQRRKRSKYTQIRHIFVEFGWNGTVFNNNIVLWGDHIRIKWGAFHSLSIGSLRDKYRKVQLCQICEICEALFRFHYIPPCFCDFERETYTRHSNSYITDFIVMLSHQDALLTESSC